MAEVNRGEIWQLSCPTADRRRPALSELREALLAPWVLSPHNHVSGAGDHVVEHLGDIGPTAGRILAHLHLLPPGDGSRALPTEAGPGAPAGVGLREPIYEPVCDDLPWAEPA